MNRTLLHEVMKAHGDKCKDLAVALGMSVPNFSTIWNGRQEFSMKYIRRIVDRYHLTAQQTFDIFIVPDAEAPDET